MALVEPFLMLPLSTGYGGVDVNDATRVRSLERDSSRLRYRATREPDRRFVGLISGKRKLMMILR